MWILLIVVAAVAAVWAIAQLLPSQRYATRFLYDRGDLPDVLNGGYPGDDVSEAYAGDPADGAWPSVAVVVPGRNEGHLLRKTLGSICAMDYPALRVVFVDDQSTDNTTAVCDELEAIYPHLTVIHNQTPPRDGWVGKVWAVHQADALMHDSDYLLFTDADLVFDRDCLRQMIRLALHRRTDLASLLPWLRFETVGELLGLLPAMVLINTKYSLYVCNDPRRPRALVAGGFLLARRAAYEEMGGHAAVRGQVIEDIALGTLAKSKGYRVFTACTHTLFSARMYEGWRDTYRGLKKNSYAGANYKPLVGVGIVLFLLFAGALMPVYPVVGCLLWITQPSLMTFGIAVAGIVGLASMLVAGRRGARVLGLPWWTAWILPFGFTFYLAVFLGSMADYYRGGNVWAGRRMPSRELQTLEDAEA